MIEIIIILVCIGFNGLLSLVEMAFVSVSKPELKGLAKSNSHAQRLLKLRERPERTLSVLQIGITIVGALSAAIGGVEVLALSVALADGLRILGSCMERSINIGPPICEECRRPMLWLGRLPKIALRPVPVGN